MSEKKQLTAYDRVKQHLFESDTDTNLTEADLRVKKRCLSIYAKKLEDPLIEDHELVNMLTEFHQVSKSQAYLDISNVERMFGDFRQANKEYIRYIVTENQKWAIKQEREFLENGRKKSTKDLSSAAKVLVSAHGLDREDPNMPDWNELNLPDIVPSDDVTIHDLQNVSDETIEKLKKKYEARQKIEDAEVISDSE